MKGRELQQRGVLLAEMTALAAQLAAQAGEHYPAKLAAAEEMCSAQSRLKGVTRRIMALVSELSMYQVGGAVPPLVWMLDAAGLLPAGAWSPACTRWA
jgi:hypothetical protein